MKTQPRLREANKARTHGALLAAATRLYLEAGYDATTVEQIAQAAGVARRTFFRYFPRKDDTVFPHQQERLELFRARLAHHRTTLPPFGAVAAASLDLAAVFSDSREHLALQARIMEGSAALVARQAEFDREWERAIFEALRPGPSASPVEERHARVFAGAVMGMVQCTLDTWRHDESQDLARLGAEALDWIERGYTASIPAKGLDEPAAVR